MSSNLLHHRCALLFGLCVTLLACFVPCHGDLADYVFPLPHCGPQSGGTVVTFTQRINATFPKPRVNATYECEWSQTDSSVKNHTEAIWVDDHHVYCHSPPWDNTEGVVNIALQLNDQVFKVPEDSFFFYSSNLTLTDINPKTGPISGSTRVELAGMGLMACPSIVCEFTIGEVVIRVPGAAKHSVNTVVCSSPDTTDISNFTSGEASISVALDGQHFVDALETFYYYDDVRSLEITPELGPISGGTLITITGDGDVENGAKIKFRCSLDVTVPIAENIPVDAIAMTLIFDGTPAFVVVTSTTNPVIRNSHQGSTGLRSMASSKGMFNFVRCIDRICSESSTTPLFPGSVSDMNEPVALVEGEAFPSFVYYDYHTEFLTLLICPSLDCTRNGAPPSAIYLTQGKKGVSPSLALGVDRRLVMSFHKLEAENATTGCLRVLYCDDSDCSREKTIDVDCMVGATAYVDFLNAMTIGSDGNPMIVYNKMDSIYFIHCVTLTCDEPHTEPVYIESLDSLTQSFNIAVGADGFPVMTYYVREDTGRGDLRFIKCWDLDCHDNTKVYIDYASGDVGEYNALDIGADGLPVVAYYDGRITKVKAATCLTATCNETTIRILDKNTKENGKHVNMAVMEDGLPLLSYYDKSNSQVKVARCVDMECGKCPFITSAPGLNDTALITTSPEVQSDGIRYVDLAPNGQQFLDKSFGVPFHFYDVQVPSLTPNCGPVEGGTAVKFSLSSATYFNASANFMALFTRNTTSLSASLSNPYIFGVKTNPATGFPWIAFIMLDHKGMTLLTCKNAECTSYDQTTVIKTDLVDVQTFDMAVGPDGLLTFASVQGMYKGIQGDLTIIRCADPLCSNSTWVTVGRNVSFSASLAFSSGGFPMVSYHRCLEDADFRRCGSGGLGLVVCEDVLCQSVTDTLLVDDVTVGWYSQVINAPSSTKSVTGEEGLPEYTPVLLYTDFSTDNRTLMFKRCTAINCGEGDAGNATELYHYSNTLTIRQEDDPSMSLALDGEGNPVVSFVQMSVAKRIVSAVLLLACNSLDCTDNTVNPLDTNSMAGAGTSIAVEEDGTIDVAYTVMDQLQQSLGHVKISHCLDRWCNNVSHSIQSAEEGNLPRLSFDYNKSGTLVFLGAKNWNLLVTSCVRKEGCEERVVGPMSDKKCMTPPSSGPRQATVQLSFNSQQFNDVKMDFSYYDAKAFNITPISGDVGDVGGLVTVDGSGFINTKYIACRFGETDPTWVGGRFINSTSILCTFPVLNVTGSYPVYITLNGQDEIHAGNFLVEHSNHGGGGGPNYIWLIYVVVGAVVVIGVIALVFGYKRKGYQSVLSQDDQDSSLIVPSRILIKSSELKFLARIGSGSYSEVHEAMYRGRRVAVKKLETSRLRRDSWKEFEMECALLSNLSHPNVLEFLGAVTKPPCLVTEFCSRGSLHSVLHGQEVISWEMVLKMAKDTCRGMVYLHGFNPKIIHRDLKTANLLVDQDWNVKVGDFGLSRFKDTEHTMTVVGTPAWAGPEVLRHQNYSEKADVYSFAIVLWELMTRFDPYSGMAPAQIIIGVIERRLRPEIFPFFPEPLVRLMVDCWDENPDNRPDFVTILKRLEDMDIATWQSASLASAHLDWWMEN